MEVLIRRCFELAKKAKGETSPNPLVGSVIVDRGLIVSEGYHKKSGLPHAEIEAINAANGPVAGMTLYCNLEPCCHTNKKTPPCTDRIIEEGIKKVVISNLDPNPEVAGKGVEKLRAAGIEVITGILEEEGAILNEVFFTHIQKKRPFIHLKWAQTLDGKLATKTNHSKWITNEKSRQRVHHERSLYDAIAIGAGTLRHDDPALTVRITGKDVTSKTRLVFSQTGQINHNQQIFTDNFKDKSLVISPNPVEGLRHLLCPKIDERIDMASALELLYANQGITSIYVEGGAKLLNAFLENGLWDRISVYIAPKILGDGIGTLDHVQLESMDKAIQFEHGVWTNIGTDIVFENRKNLCLQD